LSHSVIKQQQFARASKEKNCQALHEHARGLFAAMLSVMWL